MENFLIISTSGKLIWEYSQSNTPIFDVEINNAVQNSTSNTKTHVSHDNFMLTSKINNELIFLVIHKSMMKQKFAEELLFEVQNIYFSKNHNETIDVYFKEKFKSILKTVEKKITKKVQSENSFILESINEHFKKFETKYHFITKEKVEESMKNIMINLEKANVSASLCKQISQEVSQKLTGKCIENNDTEGITTMVNDAVQEEIKKIVQQNSTFQNFLNTPKKPKVIHLFGERGSGKLTCLLKIGLLLKNKNLKIMINCFSHYKNAFKDRLIQQCKKLQFDYFDSDDDLSKSIQDAIQKGIQKDIDVILAYTSINQNEELIKQLNLLSNFIDFNFFVGDFYISIFDFIERFQKFESNVKVDGVILTKMDALESENKYGMLLDLKNSINVPVSFITDGQQYNDIHYYDVQENLTTRFIILSILLIFELQIIQAIKLERREEKETNITCYGKEPQKNACSSNGKCIKQDVCECDTFTWGNECEESAVLFIVLFVCCSCINFLLILALSLVLVYTLDRYIDYRRKIKKNLKLEQEKPTEFFPIQPMKLKIQSNPDSKLYGRIIQIGDELVLFQHDIFKMNLESCVWKRFRIPHFPHLLSFTVVHDEIRNQYILFGGYEKVVVHYDPVNDKILVKTSDIALKGHSAVAYENKIYLFGGDREDTPRRTEKCLMTYSYDLKTFEWDLVLTPGDVPPVCQYSEAVKDKQGRIFFSCTHGLYQFFPDNNNSWIQVKKSISNEDSYFEHRSMISVGIFLYFIGIFANDSNIYRYNKETQRIEFCNAGELNKKSFYGHSSCLINHNSKWFIYTYGGHCKHIDKVYNDLYEFDVTREAMVFDSDHMIQILKNQKLFDINFHN
eukprot:gene5543-9362_t